MNWTWDPKDRKVRIAETDHPETGIDLAWKLPTAGELRAFDYGLEKARRVYLTLESARGSFEGGRAKYENATEEVKHLIEETNKSAMELLEAMAVIDRWFESPVSPLFKGDADGFLSFCKTWIDRQGHPPEVVGNSSRGPSGNLRMEPPKTAETASVSLSDLAENIPVSASGRTKGSRRKTAPAVRSS